MAIFRKAVLAAALIGSGLVSVSGLASATEGGHQADQDGLANAQGVQTVTPADACHNDVPVNVLGVQVPVQDVAADVPVASPTDDGGNGGSVAKSCGNSVSADD